MLQYINKMSTKVDIFIVFLAEKQRFEGSERDPGSSSYPTAHLEMIPKP